MAAPLNTCTTTEQRGVVPFFFVGIKYGSKGFPQKKCCPCTVNIACQVRQSIIGCRSSRRADKYRRWTSSRSAGGDRHAGNVAARRRHHPSREGHRRRCSKRYWLFTWPGLQHDAWGARLPQSVLPLGAMPGVLLLLHDNARPHSANQTTVMLRSFKWEVLQHPPYSPDLTPSDFHLLGPLKHHLSGERFPDDDAVERAMRAWFRQQPKEFYAAGFQGLVKQWDKCLNLYGDYVEK